MTDVDIGLTSQSGADHPQLVVGKLAKDDLVVGHFACANCLSVIYGPLAPFVRGAGGGCLQSSEAKSGVEPDVLEVHFVGLVHS
uniref:hypothetical protein n=1 Tax=Mesorhizobium sp. Mes31 TaxID=2926017 RepID=UPI002117D4AE